MKFSVLPSENNANKVEKENVNRKKNPAMKARKNGHEGHNDAQVLETYNFDTMTRNLG